MGIAVFTETQDIQDEIYQRSKASEDNSKYRPDE